MTRKTPRDQAKALLDERFGLGRDAAHYGIRTDAITSAVYQCAVEVVTSLLEPSLPDRTFAFRESATSPLKYVMTPGVTVEPGDWLALDRSTGKVRKAVATDLTKFIAPLGSRMTDDGYLEMPI
ncbi:hypothetical protein [Sphingomonas sp. TREG-RG-20F-R18-01]|uniref:hypothetical protein n=1 Tax=Sphingomonas sp. TREG-RG-20F-R18-01 TaxID=2914982 RepID=UPI001F5A9EFB|nr:hypothetical protein [Sphingomonas sp. TREG-RG-20F-R18-01]